jgi:hypothetical protein
MEIELNKFKNTEKELAFQLAQLDSADKELQNERNDLEKV